jgi:NDP-sugar pyrophosphorylase family protein
LTGPGVPAQAVLLAGGLGTRLRPATKSTPKCMLPVAGRPILEHVIRHLAGYGVTELLVNLHHLGSVISDYFGDGRQLGVRITYAPEEELLGTAGTVREARGWLRHSFLVWYADNLSYCRLDRMAVVHHNTRAQVTIAAHYRADPTGSGVMVTDTQSQITGFQEKPSDITGPALVNAGIYLLERDVLDQLPADVPCDFGADVFPALLASGTRAVAYVLRSDEGLWWSDQPADLAITRSEFTRAGPPGIGT